MIDMNGNIVRFYLTGEERDILLDEFLLRPDIRMMARHVSDNNFNHLARRCFVLAYQGSMEDRYVNNSNTTEKNLINIAQAMLIGYQLGKDIKSGVSQRGVAANE